MRFPLALIAIAALAQPIGAATYYVDSAVGSPGDGLSWATAWANVTDAHGLRGGDTVFISGGTSSRTYAMGDWTPPSGDAGDPIRFRVAQDAGRSGTVVFDGTGHHYWIFANENFRFAHVVVDGEVAGSDANHIEIRGYDWNTLDIDAPGGADFTLRYATAWAPLRAYGCNGIAYEHLVVGPSVGVDGLIVGLGSGENYTNNRISDCSFFAYYQHDVNAEGGNGDDVMQNITAVTVSRCRFVGVLTDHYVGSQHQDGIQCASWVRVESCRFENMANYMFYGDFFASGGHQQLVDNVFDYSDPVLSAQPSCAIAIGSEARGIALTDIVIANNTVRGGGRGISLGAGYPDITVSGCAVVNNLVIDSSFELIGASPGGVPQYGGAGITRIADKAQRGASVDTSMNQDGSAPNADAVRVVDLAGGDFHLAADDTGAADQGSAWPAAYTTTDLDGVARPQGGAWDIGAYERVVGAGGGAGSSTAGATTGATTTAGATSGGGSSGHRGCGAGGAAAIVAAGAFLLARRAR